MIGKSGTMRGMRGLRVWRIAAGMESFGGEGCEGFVGQGEVGLAVWEEDSCAWWEGRPGGDEIGVEGLEGSGRSVGGVFPGPEADHAVVSAIDVAY